MKRYFLNYRPVPGTSVSVPEVLETQLEYINRYLKNEGYAGLNILHQPQDDYDVPTLLVELPEEHKKLLDAIDGLEGILDDFTHEPFDG